MTPSSSKLCEDASLDCAELSPSNYIEIRGFEKLHKQDQSVQSGDKRIQRFSLISHAIGIIIALSQKRSV